MTVGELSAVSGKLISLTCGDGFYLPAQADLSLLQFSRLELVYVRCQNDSDLQFIMNIIENSSGCDFLKKLKLFLDIDLSTTSLIKIIEVSNYFYNCSGFIRVDKAGVITQSIIHGQSKCMS
jgi:hypothetical protein